MNKKGYSIFLAGALLSGCAPMPQNAEEFRKTIGAGGSGTSFETYEVNRPYSKVAATLKTKAKECLDAKVVVTECVNRSCQSYDTYYLPTLVSGTNKTELHVQWKMVPDKTNFANGKPPASGLYIAVADAVPVGNGKTRMSVYGMSRTFGMVPEAIKHWANGTNMGCPNLSRDQ